MTDYTWPDDLVPYSVSFYLQPHTGGSESPFTRQSKIYGLSAPRWICRMAFRGGYAGTEGLNALGPRLEAFIDKLEGRLNRATIYDFRRPAMRAKAWPSGASNLAAVTGALTMTITGLPPGLPVYAGDYLGGDGRPHRITDTVYADNSGNAVVLFKPPLKAAIAAAAAIFGKPTGLFRLTSDDAGDIATTVGEAVEVSLEFVEDL